MLEAAIVYLVAGILFAEVSRFAPHPEHWLYPWLVFTWPLLVPVVIYRFHRGKKNGARH